jgi:hypothetical protein
MFALSWTIGRVLKVAQLVLSGVVITKEAVDLFRDKAVKDD